ncbi:MAG: 2'-5' RNA ligase family protein [Cyclonatronaceae bacterium]
MPSEAEPHINGCSVWLTFGRAEKKLAHYIAQLSDRLNTPVFRPHVTLAGQIGSERRSLLETTSWLASVTDPFRIYCRQFGSEPSYFKALYLEVTLATPLKDLRLLTEKHLPAASPGFMPHISLVYGNLNAESRSQIISELGIILPYTADVTTITIMKTDGPVSAWHQIKEFELGN